MLSEYLPREAFADIFDRVCVFLPLLNDNFIFYRRVESSGLQGSDCRDVLQIKQLNSLYQFHLRQVGELQAIYQE